MASRLARFPVFRSFSSQYKHYWDTLSSYAHEPGMFTFDTKHHPAWKDRSQLMASACCPTKGTGDIAPEAAARDLCELYQSVDRKGRRQFLLELGKLFDVNVESVNHAAKHLLEQERSDEAANRRLRSILRGHLRPPMRNWMDRVARLPGGLGFLISMRSELLKEIDSSEVNSEERNALEAVDVDLKFRLQSWVAGGYLELKRVTWTSPAALLEKIMEYESVHPFNGWSDIKQRLGPGRRIYAFGHQGLPDEALVSVQVALEDHISGTITSILQDSHPGQFVSEGGPTCAIFYSISTQKGLYGVELGSFLIKRVVQELKAEFPGLDIFCTLSPIPGFRQWLYSTLGNDRMAKDVTKRWVSDDDATMLRRVSGETSIAKAILDLTSKSDWFKEQSITNALQRPMTGLCAHYLALERTTSGTAQNSVAHFHLRNGACIHNIRFLANTTDRGMKESLGMMVNYRYISEWIEECHRRYLNQGVIGISPNVPSHLDAHPIVKWKEALLQHNPALVECIKD